MNNYYGAPAALQRVKKGSPGGWCKMYYAPVGDVDTLPGVALSGQVENNITLKAGKSWRMLPVPDGVRGYKEEVKEADGGPYTETTITTNLPFGSSSNAVQLVRMKYERYICIIVTRDRVQRLIGSKESPVTLATVFDNGQRSVAAGTAITLRQVSEDGPVIYTGTI